MNPVPAYQTSEFWLTLASQIMGFMAMVGIMTQAEAASIETALANGITAGTVVIASVVSLVHYIKTRVALKTAHLSATPAGGQSNAPSV